MTDLRTVMSGPVLTVDPQDSAADAARLMRDEDTGDVIVMRDGALLGMVTDRDLAIRLVAEELDPSAPLTEVMTSDPVVVDADDSVETAAARMRKYSIRRLPVVENSAVVGFISLGDLAQHIDTDDTLSDISQSAPNW